MVLNLIGCYYRSANVFDSFEKQKGIFIPTDVEVNTVRKRGGSCYPEYDVANFYFLWIIPIWYKGDRRITCIWNTDDYTIPQVQYRADDMSKYVNIKCPPVYHKIMYPDSYWKYECYSEERYHIKNEVDIRFKINDKWYYENYKYNGREVAMALFPFIYAPSGGRTGGIYYYEKKEQWQQWHKDRGIDPPTIIEE